MTSFERFEREIPRLMDELAPSSLPDYMDDMLRATARTAQRPAWRSFERWIPMGEIARTVPGPTIPWRPLILVALLALLLTAGLLVAGGSAPRLPAPFGPAMNGSMFYHGEDGVIYAMDPASGVSTPVVSGPEVYSFPLPSRDGQRIVYDHAEGDTSQPHIADADGSDAHSLGASLTGWTWTEWSPQGDRLAVISLVGRHPTLAFLATDGSGMTPSRFEREAKVAWYLPDGRLALIAAEDPTDRCRPDGSIGICALWVSDGDGGNARMLLDAATFSGLTVNPSPDGSELLYVRWATGEEGRLHVYDIATGEDRQVRIDNQDPIENINQAWFSPDGSQILFDRFEVDGGHWAVVPSAGGDAVNIGRDWDDPEVTGTEAQFTPDGRSVLAFYGTSTDGTGELWLLDVTGEGADRQLAASMMYAPVFQRLASDAP
jgi:hypothetical protein